MFLEDSGTSYLALSNEDAMLDGSGTGICCSFAFL